MLNVITNPVGIDAEIKRFQTDLHNSLMEKWGLDVNVAAENKLYQCYGRCYRNKKDNGYIAEVFDGGKDYKDAYWDDSLRAISFFGISNSIRHELVEKAEVHLVFFVDLKKLKPTLVNRADEEVRLDVLNAVADSPGSFVYTSMDLWLENVLKEYPGTYRDERLKTVDMQPRHCFRLNFTLLYDKNNC